MKIQTVFRLIFSIVILFASTEIFAQENMEKWIENCENDKTVDVTVIREYFPDTKKPDKHIVKITFQKRPRLFKSLIAAYEKDKHNAVSLVDERVNGVMNPSYCIFIKREQDKTETEIGFYFNHKSETNTWVVTMIKTFDINNKFNNDVFRNRKLFKNDIFINKKFFKDDVFKNKNFGNGLE